MSLLDWRRFYEGAVNNDIVRKAMEKKPQEHGHEQAHEHEQAQISVPFTAEQIAHIREIVREELAKWERQQLQARRFGLPPGAEVK